MDIVKWNYYCRIAIHDTISLYASKTNMLDCHTLNGLQMLHITRINMQTQLDSIVQV